MVAEKPTRGRIDAARLSCQECKRPWSDPNERWRLYLTDDDPPAAVAYCPSCAKHGIDEEVSPAAKGPPTRAGLPREILGNRPRQNPLAILRSVGAKASALRFSAGRLAAWIHWMRHEVRCVISGGSQASPREDAQLRMRRRAPLGFSTTET